MAKSYTEQLAEWVKKREASRPRQDKNVVAFLAVRADVKDAMDAGYALKTIWEHLHETGKIAYRYETFLKHVKRHIKQAPPDQVKPAEEKPADTGKGGSKPGSKAAPKAPSEPKKSEAPPVGGFTFDASPKKEDLI
ncbi:TraK family protein [Escherichia coli]|uniref:OriT binding protein n=2 Tax=root TaxID=1 RepID=F2Q6A0_9BACT|nr:oriT binding protein [Plasmid pMCBF1]ABO36591.1 OriT binding protein [uncultured bacterium pMCBF6]EDC6278224.1 conjugal transfer protein TraK [Salmonella enterica subsp. enterica serovar Enteritidis]